MAVCNLLTGLVLLLLGAAINRFNLSFLISGYNTASKEEKAKYDERKLTRHVGNLLMVSSGILIVSGAIFALFDIPEYAAGISWGLFILVIISGLIYINTGNRVKKQRPD